MQAGCTLSHSEVGGGNPAVVDRYALRPVALRPRLSTGLPLSLCATSVGVSLFTVNATRCAVARRTHHQVRLPVAHMRAQDHMSNGLSSARLTHHSEDRSRIIGVHHPLASARM
jgi:hypothetical protein